MNTLCTALTRRTREGSTERLLQLSFGYFLSYILTGIFPKYFMNKAPGYPAMNSMEYLVYSTIASSLLCVSVVIVLKWYTLHSSSYASVGGVRFAREILYIIPSGICTAVVIPTTTLMYLLPISVMVAMTIMRSSIIIMSRVVDAIQIRQGILKKRVYKEENIAVVFALLAVGLKLWYVKAGDFDFVHNAMAMTILITYVVAYSIRIYIMNYFKNTRPKGVPYDNKGFFGVEQLAASGTMAVACVLLLFVFSRPNAASSTGILNEFHASFFAPHPRWGSAALAGLPFGVAAFFSVFLFMFKGRTATFAGLVNRLTSLIAGTVATLLASVLMGMRPPAVEDWLGLGLILVAIYFMAIAERKRACELALAREIETDRPVGEGRAGACTEESSGTPR